MEITKDNITQAISALRQCAKEHKRDNTPTCGVIVSELCTDVADYLEKIKGADVIQLPSEKEIEDAMKTSVTESILCVSPYTQFTPRATDLLECAWMKGAEWLKSKIVK